MFAIKPITNPTRYQLTYLAWRQLNRFRTAPMVDSKFLHLFLKVQQKVRTKTIFFSAFFDWIFTHYSFVSIKRATGKKLIRKLASGVNPNQAFRHKPQCKKKIKKKRRYPLVFIYSHLHNLKSSLTMDFSVGFKFFFAMLAHHVRRLF